MTSERLSIEHPVRTALITIGIIALALGVILVIIAAAQDYGYSTTADDLAAQAAWSAWSTLFLTAGGALLLVGIALHGVEEALVNAHLRLENNRRALTLAAQRKSTSAAAVQQAPMAESTSISGYIPKPKA